MNTRTQKCLVITCHLMSALFFSCLVGTTGSHTAAGSSFNDSRVP
jgi:hypothetical protein